MDLLPELLESQAGIEVAPNLVVGHRFNSRQLESLRPEKGDGVLQQAAADAQTAYTGVDRQVWDAPHQVLGRNSCRDVPHHVAVQLGDEGALGVRRHLGLHRAPLALPPGRRQSSRPPPVDGAFDADQLEPLDRNRLHPIEIGRRHWADDDARGKIAGRSCRPLVIHLVTLYTIEPEEPQDRMTASPATNAEQPPIREGAGQRPAARRDPRLDWWRDAKFGLFIHWGLYAIPAGEWKGQRIPGIGEWIMLRARVPVHEYEQLAGRFNPVKFDAAEWVSLARRAGQKYLVITAKHHDGFCLFDSKFTEYDIVDATPFGRDPLKELAAECQKQGVKLGFYYSQTQDWHHQFGDGNDWDYAVPSDEQFDRYVRGYVAPQVRELLTNYGPICLIWFDTPKRMTPDQSCLLTDLVHELQPDCLVSGRVGNQLGDYAEARDNVIPDAAVEMDWETPATINDTWGFKHYDQDWKSVSDLVRKLVDSASKGGNYLLNVGPTAEGVIPPPSVERLLGVGEWLQRNGESVYGTRRGPLQSLGWARTTAKPGKLYLHVFDWPAGGHLRQPSLGQAPSGASLLADGTRLRVTREGDTLVIAGPAAAPDPIDTVVVLDT